MAMFMQATAIRTRFPRRSMGRLACMLRISGAPGELTERLHESDGISVSGSEDVREVATYRIVSSINVRLQ